MAFRASSTPAIFASESADVPVAVPAGTVSSDILLAWLVYDGEDTFTSVEGGWNDLGYFFMAAPDGASYQLLWRTAGGSEPANYKWHTGSAGARDGIFIMGCWSGRTGTPVAQPTENTTENATPISVALTGVTASNGDDLAWFAQLDKKATADVWGFANPTNFIEQQDTSNVAGGSGWVHSTLHTRDNFGGGATGTITGTATRSSGSSGAGFSGFVVRMGTGAAPSGVPKTTKLTLLGVG